MLKFFAEKMWVAFAVQKLLTFFSAKHIRILCIETAKTVNEMTLNELVKLTTLWTTGPWSVWVISLISDKGLGTIKPGILSIKDKQAETQKGECKIGEFGTGLPICAIGNIIWAGAQQLSFKVTC